MTDLSKSFADLGVDPAICRALEESGIVSAFPIQELTLPLALSRADVIGQARTGTGKTLAFGIPLLQAVEPARKVTQALVIVPTRELCLQVHDDITTAGKGQDIVTVALYGGKAIETQSNQLNAGAHVVVGTPGRLLDLKRRGVLDLSGVATLVLDEADEMLDMGFLPDVEQLIEACGTQRQTLLFSATMPAEVVGLARRYMNKPTFMRADVEEPQIAPETQQVFLACHRLDKPAVLARILRTPKRGLCVVFTRTKRMADVLVSELDTHGVTASAIHSNLRQDARERTLERFRRGKVDVLCATEVAARGLDISDVTHVVNYDCPDDEKMYLHRIGRTGRAGAAGVAVTLVLWNEQARLEMIKKALEIDAPTHEVFSTSPQLDALFDLPPQEARSESKPAAPQQPPKGGDRPAGDGRSRSSRRRRRSGGGRATEAGGSRDAETTTPQARPATQTNARPGTATGSDEPSEPAAASAASGPGESEATPSAGIPERADSGGAERRRVRRRTEPRGERTARPDRSATSAQDPAGRRRNGSDPDASSPAPATEEAAPVADPPAAHREPDEAADSSATQGGSGRAGDQSARSPGRSRSRGRGKRGGGGGNGQRRPAEAPKTHAEPAPVPQGTAARGSGQPALNRPMKILHLP